jgi:7,8-dihydropterin-6-yl-methyl-4-(beta-D-ribofuranosyl)aminobenzene 5'-phosphate synthase
MKWFSVLILCGVVTAADRAVVLFDSPAAPGLADGWGYSLYIENRGKRILFDTGPSPTALETNARALGIDLTKLDAVIISHDDSDHFAGLPHIASVHRNVPVYVPESDYGAFGLSGLNGFFRFFQALMPRNDVVDPPKGLRYVRVAREASLDGGMRLVVFNFGDGRKEQALVVDRPGGAVLFSGCAHPGIANMVRGAGTSVRVIAGGFHLAHSSEAEIRKTAAELKASGVRAAIPGHCSGPKATSELKRQFGAGLRPVAAGGSFPLPE